MLSIYAETPAAALRDGHTSFLVASLGPAFYTPPTFRGKAYAPVEISFVRASPDPAFAVTFRRPGTARPVAIFGPYPRFTLAREAVQVALLHHDTDWLLQNLKSSPLDTGALLETLRSILDPIRAAAAPVLENAWDLHDTPDFIEVCHAHIRAAALAQRRPLPGLNAI